VCPDRPFDPRDRPEAGGDVVPHLATSVGARESPAFQKAYWRAFEKTFGEQNSHMIKAMLLSKVKKGDTGETELDRVCLGLRMTMGWLAEAIERTALEESGYGDSTSTSAKPQARVA